MVDILFWLNPLRDNIQYQTEEMFNINNQYTNYDKTLQICEKHVYELYASSESV